MAILRYCLHCRNEWVDNGAEDSHVEFCCRFCGKMDSILEQDIEGGN